MTCCKMPTTFRVLFFGSRPHPYCTLSSQQIPDSRSGPAASLRPSGQQKEHRPRVEEQLVTAHAPIEEARAQGLSEAGLNALRMRRRTAPEGSVESFTVDGRGAASDSPSGRQTRRRAYTVYLLRSCRSRDPACGRRAVSRDHRRLSVDKCNPLVLSGVDVPSFGVVGSSCLVVSRSMSVCEGGMDGMARAHEATLAPLAAGLTTDRAGYLFDRGVLECVPSL